MTTEGNQGPFPFHPLNQREIRGQFDGGSITSDAGFCCCGRWKSGRTSSANSPAALATIGVLVETRDGRVVGATDLRIGIRLRGFKRSRGVAARSVVGGAGREGGSDRETAARRRIGRRWIFFCKR